MTAEQQAPVLRNGTAINAAGECLFWLTAAVLLFIFPGTGPLHTGEDRWAESAREMLLVGDYFRARLGFQAFPDLPLLPCWLLMPGLLLFGAVETAVRLPSMLAALLLLWGVRSIGRQLFDPRTALLSCWMMLGSFGLLRWGRMGAPDMAGAAAGLLAAAWFLRAGKGSGFPHALVFFLLCFCGFLLKGPVVLLAPGAAVLPLLAADKDRRALLNWKTAAAFFTVAAAAVLVFSLPWLLKQLSGNAAPAAELLEGPLRQFHPANMLRTMDLSSAGFKRERIDGLLRLLMPWTPFLIAGWIGLFRNRKALSPDVRRVAAGMLGALVLLIPFVLRKWHAALPMAPLFLLYGAAGLAGYGTQVLEKRTRDIMYYLATAASSFFIGSLLAYPLWEKMGWASPDPVLAFAPAAAGLLAWGGLFLDHREGSSFSVFLSLPHRLGTSVVAAVVLTGTVLSVLMPVLQAALRGEKPFFLEIGAIAEKNGLRPGRIIIYDGRLPEDFLFYNDVSLPLCPATSLRKAVALMPGADVLVMFKGREQLRRSFAAETAALGIPASSPVAMEKKHRWSPARADGEYFVAYMIQLPKNVTEKGPAL